MQDYEGRYLKNPQSLLFEVIGHVARITLNRPEKRNAISDELLAELCDALLEADARLDVHAILLQGAGKDFCAGFDLVMSYDVAEVTSATEQIRYRASAGVFDDEVWNLERNPARFNLIYEIHKPIIAKIQGNCLAGGTDIAFRCDIVVAADDAKIGYPATRANGSPPSHMWTYHLGPQWAKRMLLTGDTLTGKDAARLGLVLDSVPADQIDDFAMDLASRIALVDPEISATQKRIVNMTLEAMGMNMIQRLAIENDARAHLSTGPRRTRFKTDMKEGGLKTALNNRDGDFGSSVIRLHARD